MAQFDSAAATGAYLAVLSPQAHAKAQAYTQGGHWLLLWSVLAAVLVSWLVLRSGVLVRIRAGLEAKPHRPWLIALAVLAADALFEMALSLPWEAYAHWWRERAYGFTNQAFPGWAAEWALKGGLSMLVTLAMLSGLYALIRRAPKTWWLWGGAVVAGVFVLVMVVAPIVAEPLFNTYRPAPEGPVRDAVVQMAVANGVPADKIYVYNGSKQSNRYTANVAGLFGTARVAMSDVMFAKGADLAEVRGVVGHEMGHYKHAHIIWMALTYGVLALVGFFLADRLFPVLLGWSGARGVRGIADPAGFPVMAIIIAVLSLAATPIYASISRISEVDADRYSLEHVNEPDGLAKALVKTIEYRAATPSRLEEVLFYDHPSVGSRVRMAMDWKAAHPRPQATAAR